MRQQNLVHCEPGALLQKGLAMAAGRGALWAEVNRLDRIFFGARLVSIALVRRQLGAGALWLWISVGPPCHLCRRPALDLARFNPMRNLQ